MGLLPERRARACRLDPAHIGSYGSALESTDRQSIQKKESIIMGGKTDIVKGRIKEAAGALTDNDKLRNKGKTDQAVGEFKQAAKKVVEKVSKKTRG